MKIVSGPDTLTRVSNDLEEVITTVSWYTVSVRVEPGYFLAQYDSEQPSRVARATSIVGKLTEHRVAKMPEVIYSYNSDDLERL